MKIRIIVPVVYNGQSFKNGSVIDVSVLDASRMIHNHLAVPVPIEQKRQTLPIEEQRHVRPAC